MSNPFKKESVNYKGDESTTPYQRAHDEWDVRIGNARVQAKNWRICAFFTLIIALLLLVSLIFVLVNRKDRVYIAEVTKEGHVVNVAPILVRYQPNEAQKEYFVAHFVELVRSLPLDPVVAKQNWLNSYYFLSGRGAERLNAFFRQNNPVELLGKKTVTIQISNVNSISASTLHMGWIETIVNAQGQEESKKSYSGVFTLAIKQPTSKEEILRNPLGIYIVDFNISQQEGA